MFRLPKPVVSTGNYCQLNRRGANKWPEELLVKTYL